MKRHIFTLVFLFSLFGFVEMVSAASLTITPSAGSYSVGQTFNAQIKLDTAGQNIDGVDIYFLHYDPKLVQVTSIKPGSLFPQTLANSIDPTTGKITFSQVTSGGQQYKGSGVLATLSMKALAPGSANLAFDFTRGNTTDTNAAGGGEDLLSQVTNAQLTITNTPVSTPPPASEKLAQNLVAPSPQDVGPMTPPPPPVVAPPPVNTTSDSGMPKWIYLVGGIAVLGILIWFFSRKKS